MAAGIPGVGIAGLFFVVCALLMPVAELGKWARGRGDSRAMRIALRQATMAAGVLAWLIGTSWLLLLAPGAPNVVLTITGMLATTVVLSLVLICVRTVAVIRRPRQSPT